jgi:hypothetical protein
VHSKHASGISLYPFFYRSTVATPLEIGFAKCCDQLNENFAVYYCAIRKAKLQGELDDGKYINSYDASLVRRVSTACSVVTVPRQRLFVGPTVVVNSHIVFCIFAVGSEVSWLAPESSLPVGGGYGCHSFWSVSGPTEHESDMF